MYCPVPGMKRHSMTIRIMPLSWAKAQALRHNIGTLYLAKDLNFLKLVKDSLQRSPAKPNCHCF
jgi:hypothetical protein